MIVRNYLRCPGCRGVVIARVSVFPTDLLRFYFLCPACGIPIRGSLEGHELHAARLSFDAPQHDPAEDPDVVTVTIDPSLPAPNEATSLMDGLGPNILFMQMAGDQALALSELSARTYDAMRQAPTVSRALHLYFEGHRTAYWAYLKEHFGREMRPGGQSDVAMAGTAHHLWQALLTQFLDSTWVSEAELRALMFVPEQHLAALETGPAYNTALEQYGPDLSAADRKLFDATEALLRTAAAWRSGALRLATGHNADAVSGMRLLQDEFFRLRDAYQNVFEACCDSLWIVALIRHWASQDPDRALADLSYVKDGVVTPVSSLSRFRKLTNAYKIQALSCDGTLQPVLTRLEPKLRNAIGHASARHDLRRGLIATDHGDLDYFDFVGRVYGLLLPLALCVSALRCVQVRRAEGATQG